MRFGAFFLREYLRISKLNSYFEETIKKSDMTKLEAYTQAKEVCTSYINYKGDKRSRVFKRLQNAVVDLYMGRMNNFAKQLGLPTYQETFFK